MCRASLALADATGFIRVNYFCVLLVGEIFLRVGMPPPDFSANSQIFSCLPFSLFFAPPCPTAGGRTVACREGEIPQSAARGSRRGSAGFERGFLKGVSLPMT